VNLEFLSPNLDFLSSCLDFLATDLDILATDLEILHCAGASASDQSPLTQAEDDPAGPAPGIRPVNQNVARRVNPNPALGGWIVISEPQYNSEAGRGSIAVIASGPRTKLDQVRGEAIQGNVGARLTP
jgi:hypothetical protein